MLALSKELDLIKIFKKKEVIFAWIKFTSTRKVSIKSLSDYLPLSLHESEHSFHASLFSTCYKFHANRELAIKIT